MSGFAAFLDGQPLWLIALALFFALIAARELGGWIHRRTLGRKEGREEDESARGLILSALLGLLALLTAFTFSLSLNRYEVRRAIVVSEANAIGTAEMRVRLLSPPDDARLSRMLQDYARTRLAYGLSDAAGKPALAARSAAERSGLQSAAVAALIPDARTALANLVATAINSVLDIGVEREALNAARVPGVIIFALILYNLLTATMLGFALARARARQRPATVMLFALLTLAITLILDLDRPQRGTIRIDQTPMKQLVEGFAPVPQAILR
jgi:hypothetical protein